MGKAPTGDITLVFTDMEGSSARWERDMEGTRRLLVLHDSVIRDAIERFEGYEVKTAGDSFMVAFSDPVRAAHFCMAARQATLELGVRLRIGVHRGTALEVADPVTGRMDYFGPTANKAARLENAAHPGQILVSDEAYSGASGPWLDLGEHVLRGIEGRHRLWQLGEGSFPRPRTVDLRLTNLPARPDSFIGRAEELATLRDLFERGERLVTILGPGGAGKTRLSQRVAAEVLGDRVDSAWFCDLSEARDLEGVVGAVANALEVPPARDAARQVGWAISGRGKTLIVLDNFEQVIGTAAATVAQWVAAAPKALFLATSRIPLRLRGERTVPLSSLPTADGVKLLVDRGHGVRPDDPDAARLVEQLDGLPLAIELAAARTRSMSVSEVARHLGQRFRLLAGGAADLPDRHRALRATLDWSWELMTEDQRRALGQLSVFDGGFTLEAAEAVLEVEDWPADVVQGLLEHSLLQRDRSLGRYHMLLSVVAYAQERLAERGERAGAEARHGAYFASLGEPDFQRRLAGASAASRSAFHLERENLVVACRRAIARQDAAVAMGTGAALSEILELKGPFTLGVELSDAVLAMPGLSPTQRRRAELTSWLFHRLRGGTERPLEALERLIAGAVQDGDARSVAAGQTLLGMLLHDQGAPEVALTHFEAGLVAARRVGDRFQEGVLLTQLANLHRTQGRYALATEVGQAALALHRQVGERRYEATTLSNLALILFEQGRAVEALAHFEQVLVMHREVGNRRSEGITLGNLGMVCREMARWDASAAWLRAALAVHQEVGNRSFLGIALGNLADLHFASGRFSEAMKTYGEALEVHQQMENRRSESITLCNLGELLMCLGQAELAQERFERALDLAIQVGNRRIQGIALGQLASALREQGWMEEARARVEEALAIHRAMANRRQEGSCLRGLALIQARTGEGALALQTALGAIERLRPGGDPQELALALASYAEISALMGDRDAAWSPLTEAEALVEPSSLAGREVARVRSMLAGGDLRGEKIV